MSEVTRAPPRPPPLPARRGCSSTGCTPRPLPTREGQTLAAPDPLTLHSRPFRDVGAEPAPTHASPSSQDSLPSPLGAPGAVPVSETRTAFPRRDSAEAAGLSGAKARLSIPPPPASGQAAPPSHALPSPRPRSLSSRPGPGPHLRHSQNRSNSSGTSPQGTRPSIFVASVSESVLCRSTGDQRGEQVAHRWGAAGRELYPREGPSRALVPPRGSAGPGWSGRGVEVTRGPQVDPGACRRDHRGPGPTAAIWDAPGRRLSVLVLPFGWPCPQVPR